MGRKGGTTKRGYNNNVYVPSVEKPNDDDERYDGECEGGSSERGSRETWVLVNNKQNWDESFRFG